jgi:hypothetical protein
VYRLRLVPGLAFSLVVGLILLLRFLIQLQFLRPFLLPLLEWASVPLQHFYGLLGVLAEALERLDQVAVALLMGPGSFDPTLLPLWSESPNPVTSWGIWAMLLYAQGCRGLLAFVTAVG